VLCSISGSRRVRASRRAAAVARRAGVTGPGWTDELARVFDPREEGPRWHRDLGYRGRPRLRVLLDAEDLVHSYAKALYELTGKWTGPLSEGITKAVNYGAWAGGDPEDIDSQDRKVDDPIFTPPEILTFVAIPADLIEAVEAGCLCDGYPEDRRKEVENVVLNEDGLYINEFLRSLQDDNRLLTWNRPSRLPGGAARPNTLMVQKYYQSGKPIGFRNLRARPIVLSQAMGAGSTLKVGESVEALKPGYFTDNDLWSPSKWEKAEVLAVNYDGTYDLQFFMDHGPYRENRKKGLRGTPTLSLRRNEVYADFGADKMPAKFRMMKELNYSQAVDPSQIRMPGMLDRLSDTNDTEGSQDWYICTSKKFLLTASGKGDEQRRLDDFSRQFQFDYRWVATADGDLRFEPLPNPNMAMSLKACHNEVAQQFASAANADEEARRKLLQYKGEMDEYQELLESPVQTKTAKPSRPAGPKGRGLLEEELEPVRVGR